jgi:3D (Asp-Asp-Asp) domain-containing protein/peptidoglycan hydrolase CwlO-like protein
VRARVPVAIVGLVVAVLLAAASGAGAGDPSLGAQIDQLQATDAAIVSKRRSVLLELYGLESKLRATTARLAALREESAAVAREENAAEARMAIARRAAKIAEGQLEQRLRALYMEGDVDPLALLLGARSLDDAITTLDHLDRLAGQDRAIIGQTRSARAKLKRAIAELAARRAELDALTAKAESARAALLAAKAQRSSYLASLASQRRLTQNQIASLTEHAASLSSQPQPVSGGGSTSDGASGGDSAGAAHTITVSATGYSLQGTTATGVPAGWGVVAVDPAVIPLGTRMNVPGYGEGVAADTGSAIRGYTVDLWFPTREQALAWGRRTVTITLR